MIPFGRAVLALTALGSAGILVLIPIAAWQLAAVDELPLPPLPLATLAAIQPFILLLAGALAGAFAAPRLGLRSLVAERASGRQTDWEAFRGVAPLALISVLFGILVNQLDALTLPLWLPEGADFPTYEESWSPVTLAFGLTYGGLTEEITWRFGLMSLFAWLLWSLAGRGGPPSRLVMWVAILLSALLFAAGHIPALATLLPLSPGPVIRTIIFNSAVGLWLGWLFWRRNLEIAMLAHAAIHVGFAVYALGALALP